MAGRPVGLTDVSQGRRKSRLRLLAPVRYLWIHHPEKIKYDFAFPGFVALVIWFAYNFIDPRPKLFGTDGLLPQLRDLLGITLPFLIGALASVSMGAPGPHFDRRPPGSDLHLDGEILSFRQFLCFLLGYLCFVSFTTLLLVIASILLQPTFSAWLVDLPELKSIVRSAGSAGLAILMSTLVTTVFWALYFLTDLVNRKTREAGSE